MSLRDWKVSPVAVVTVTRPALSLMETTGWERLIVLGRRRVARLRAMDCVPRKHYWEAFLQ